ncbi:hypothetical protein BJP36_40935 [Moorena producens JHB]|uniref:Uncharacterized protein n=1 Tax=Moorena producens (strain JHB) TaxID=1454205 RepID=A0A9Q9UVE1_MOOP1|nr:hypothetical protein [Moorena producens]WAN68734.1 hypothetical protein BJP36_40935 [Moorena producens JHB]
MQITQLSKKTSNPIPLLPTPDSLGALSVGELNSPRVAPLPTPSVRFP